MFSTRIQTVLRTCTRTFLEGFVGDAVREVTRVAVLHRAHLEGVASAGQQVVEHDMQRLHDDGQRLAGAQQRLVVHVVVAIVGDLLVAAERRVAPL